MRKKAMLREFDPENSYFCIKGGIHKYNSLYLALDIDGKIKIINAKSDIEEVWGTDSFSNSEITFMRNTMPKEVEFFYNDGKIHVRRADLIGWHKRFKKYRAAIYDKDSNKRK